jgi:hypothetical protein
MFNGKAPESVTASRDIAVIPDHLNPNFLEGRIIGNFLRLGTTSRASYRESRFQGIALWVCWIDA